jgi:hypothetical protein
MAQEVILHFDEAQDFRDLSQAEFSLQAKLKKRIMGWLVLERARKKQCARISYVWEGDANTCFFHLWANGRCRKNFIQCLINGNDWCFNHEDKSQIVQEHFDNIMSAPAPCTRDFSWPNLQLPSINLSALDAPFLDEEIWKTINQMPQDKLQAVAVLRGFLQKLMAEFVMTFPRLSTRSTMPDVKT